MRETRICPKCNGRDIAGPHNLHTDQNYLKIDLPGFPTATLDAFTCLNCGYTEFYPDPMGMENVRKYGRCYN